MISSMTGFGAADGVVGDARASVEIRTVNHRFFSPISSAGGVRSLGRETSASCFARRSRAVMELVAARRSPPVTTWTSHRRNATRPHATALKELQKKHSLGGEVDLATVLRLPDVINAPSEETDSKAGEALAAIIQGGGQLIAMRRTEGALPAAFLLEQWERSSHGWRGSRPGRRFVSRSSTNESSAPSPS
jgi:uncharacterized protein YicC (UPF0701 family)